METKNPQFYRGISAYSDLQKQKINTSFGTIYCFNYFPDYSQKIVIQNGTFVFEIEHEKRLFNVNLEKINGKIVSKEDSFCAEQKIDNPHEFEKDPEKNYFYIGLNIKNTQYTSSLKKTFFNHSIIGSNQSKIPIFESYMYDLLKLCIEGNVPQGVTIDDFYVNEGKNQSKAFGKVELLYNIVSPTFDYLQKDYNGEFKKVTLNDIQLIMKEIQKLLGPTVEYIYFDEFIEQLSQLQSIAEIKTTRFYELIKKRREKKVFNEYDIDDKTVLSEKGSFSKVEQGKSLSLKKDVVIKTPKYSNTYKENEPFRVFIQHRREMNFGIALYDQPHIMTIYGKLKKHDSELKRSQRQQYENYNEDYYKEMLRITSSSVVHKYENDFKNYLESLFPQPEGNKVPVKEKIVFYDDIQRHLLQIIDLTTAFIQLSQMGVIHRDLKPSNILYDSNYRLFVCDLGASLMISSGSDGSTGIFTESYAAPEQTDFKCDRTYCDLYSLGVILSLYFIKLPVERFMEVIRVSPTKIFASWKSFENEYENCKEYTYLTNFQKHLEKITTTIETRCGWYYIHYIRDLTINELKTNYGIDYQPIGNEYELTDWKEVIKKAMNIHKYYTLKYHVGLSVSFENFKEEYEKKEMTDKTFINLLSAQMQLIFVLLHYSEKEDDQQEMIIPLKEIYYSMREVLALHFINEHKYAVFLTNCNDLMELLFDYLFKQQV